MPRDLSVLALLMMSAWCGAEEDPIVTVEQGDLQGKVVTTDENKTFYSFQGIPYAKAPVGDLRFKDAQEPEAWDGTRDATQTGCICTQVETGKTDYTGCEDCLFLNVYTPQLPKQGSKPYSVMFWIHGGGFIFGSGGDEIYGPEYLVTQDIVLVTINYRLTCFGFLFLKKAAPGNVGLKDQVAALRWVNKNIATFNGDPSRITIFGESAGSASVQMHMLSPMSKGLFQGALGQSGVIMNPWAIQWKPYETSLRLARVVGCTDDDDDKIVECLRKVDHIELLKAAINHAPFPRDQNRLLLYPFGPTVDEYPVWGVERFLTGTPEQMIKDGCQSDVPFMAGLNDAEWALTFEFHMELLESDESLKILDSDWHRYVYPETRLPDNYSRVPEAMEELRKFFLNGETLTTKNVQGYTDMFTDLQTGEGIYYNLKYIVQSRISDIYVYLFSVDQDLNFLKHNITQTFKGASHADELGYLFKVSFLPDVAPDNPAYLSRERVIRLWTNFAKYGNPTPTEDSLIGKKWKPYKDEERNYLEIGNEIKNGEDLYKERVQFWEEFYKKFGAKRDESGWHWNTCSCSISSYFSWLFPFFG